MQGALAAILHLDEAIRPIKRQRYDLRDRILATFETTPAQYPRFVGEMTWTRYSRDGVERRRELFDPLDLITKDCAALERRRAERCCERNYVRGLIEAERERASARTERRQGDLFNE